MSLCEQKPFDSVVSSDYTAHMMTNTVTGKAALLMAAGSNDRNENCVLCGRFLAKVDRLPTVRGFAHVGCLMTAKIALQREPVRR